MNDGTGLPCTACDRTFDSNRALTQHRRYVHEGAELFGQRLVDDSNGELDPNPDEHDLTQTDEEGEVEPGESEPTISLANVVLIACALAAVLFIATFWATADPRLTPAGPADRPPWPAAFRSLGEG